MFGRHPRLPVDLVLPRREPACQVTYPEYVKKWRQAVEEAYALASERVGQKVNKSKDHYDIKVLCSILSPGDHVLVRNLDKRGGPGKLRAYWEDQVHIVTKHLNDDSPVYELVSESGPKKRRMLHCNLLLPCQSLPIDTTPVELRKKPKCTSAQPITRSQQQSVTVQSEESDNSSSDEEDGFMSMSPNQAPGDDHETVVPLEETETAEQVHEVESVHSLSDNEENMTVDDTQKDDTATVPGPDVEVDRDEPEDSQQAPRPKRRRLPSPVFTYDALRRPTYCWSNIAAVQGDWYQPPVPHVMGQICFSLQQVLLCLEQMNQRLNPLYVIQGQLTNFCYAVNSPLFRFHQR